MGKLTDAGLLAWQDGKGCIAPSKHDLDNDKFRKGKVQSNFLDGTDCKARIEQLNSGEQHQFRVVSEKQCLSIGEGSLWEESGKPVGYVTCEDGNKLQTFSFGHEYEGGHQQLKTSLDGFCLDAANGAGLVVYQCHPVESNNPQQQFIAKPGAALLWERHFTDGQKGSMCVDKKLDIVTFTVCATESDGTAKPGQGYKKHFVGSPDDGIFQLKESASGL